MLQRQRRTEQGDADAGGNVHVVVGDLEWVFEFVNAAVGEVGGLGVGGLGVGGLGIGEIAKQHDEELVAAQPPHDVVRPDRSVQAVPDLGEQRGADRMPDQGRLVALAPPVRTDRPLPILQHRRRTLSNEATALRDWLAAIGYRPTDQSLTDEVVCEFGWWLGCRSLTNQVVCEFGC